VKTLFLNLETRAKGTAHAPATLGQLSPIHLTVDCTQLPNPHKHFPNSTGCDDAVQTWLMQQPTVMPLLKRTVNDIADKLTVEAERADRPHGQSAPAGRVATLGASCRYQALSHLTQGAVPCIEHRKRKASVC